MDFTIEQHLDATPEQVQGALLDPAFLASTGMLPRIGGAELLEQERRGSTVHQRVRYRFTGTLSPAVTQVLDPAKLTWVDDAHYDLDTRSSRHRIVPDHYRGRFRAGYDGRLRANGAGTARVVRGHVTVQVAVVGGRVERAIVDGLREHAAAEAMLLGRWLREPAEGP